MDDGDFIKEDVFSEWATDSSGLRGEFLNQWFDRQLHYTAATCLNSSIGNYTKAYETWKRNYNIIKAIKRILPSRRINYTIMDMGCGTGYHLFSLNARFKLLDCQLVGMDLAKLDIFFAEEIKKKLNTGNLQFVVGDATDSGLPGESFDLILCSELLVHIKNPYKCIAEIKRLLKPGGHCIISTPNKDNWMIKLGNFFKRLSLRAPGEQAYSTEEGEIISVKGTKEWKDIFKDQDLKLKKLYRGSPIWGGGDRYNRQRIFFAFLLITDKILDWLPFTKNISENVVYLVQKSKP
ncbi:MAG: methyltransferase domain-containing protein [Candidatus Omnitrophica bacterium]|nr:methyltransferase domain-containing protein [Candidatus Omnitrophota bacterium]